MKLRPRPRNTTRFLTFLLLALTPLAAVSVAFAQNPFQIVTNAGASRIRLASANFKVTSADPSTVDSQQLFDTTLFNDLKSAGIFDMVSKDLIPQSSPGSQSEINLGQWSAAPSSAAMVAFGSLSVQNGRIVVNGFLDDAKNTQFPQVFAKQYNEQASSDMARQIAHRFADEIIFRLGGGVPGIAETKLYYVKILGHSKDIWEMDYDGANQHAVTHLGETSLSPRVSPDNSRIAFTTLGSRGWQIKMYSLLLGRLVNFPSNSGSDISPAWSPDGMKLAFSSARSGHPEIWVSDPNGALAQRITNFPGGNVSPTWNPRTGAQIGFISGRTHLPQLYIMDSDGSGVQRLTDGGYASSPSWSPNGQFIAFAWNRKYGPGAPGGQDIYVMEIATKRWIQLTHDIGPCDFPTWSPDGRHIAFADDPDGRGNHTRIMTMLADGTQRQALTSAGSDMPNWSWK